MFGSWLIKAMVINREYSRLISVCKYSFFQLAEQKVWTRLSFSPTKRPPSGFCVKWKPEGGLLRYLDFLKESVRISPD